MPQLVLIGLNHRTAPVAVRERAHRIGTALTDALRNWVAQPCIDEAAMLSTCNRVEVMLVTSDVNTARAVVIRQWAESCGLSESEMGAYTTTFTDEHAVHHLLRVAAGLDSVMLGETQILGQLAGALQAAQTAKTARATLNIVLSAALHTGKRARAETGLAHGARSVASAAAHLALRAVRGQHCPLIAVLGVGEMGLAAARALVGRGVRVILLNRTDGRATEAAAALRVESHPWAGVFAALTAADAVITATGAQSAVLTADTLTRVMTLRPDRPLTVVDLAVPRAVESDAAHLPNLRLYDIDALRATVDHADAARQSEAARAERLCADSADDIMTRLLEREAVPAIIALRQSAHTAAQAELDAALTHQPSLSSEARLMLYRQIRRRINQRLHAPILALKAQAATRAQPESIP